VNLFSEPFSRLEIVALQAREQPAINRIHRFVPSSCQILASHRRPLPETLAVPKA
jgi:hypothetical protein